ncbi:MAG: Xaa-Pro peptidase family protein [Armatimonadota bacterium]
MNNTLLKTNVERLQASLENAPFDVLHVTNLVNCQWLSGFTGSSCSVFVSPTKAVFVTDSRYKVQSETEVQGLEVVWHQSPKTSEQMWEEVLASLGAKTVGFEDSQTVARLARTKELLPTYQWVQASDLIKPLRMRKTPDEITRIKAACVLADKCLEHVQRMLQPGISEMDISLDIEFFFRRQGAVISFEPIVASGPNSAKPHGHATERKLEHGDFVTLDLGGKLNGYCSDITRTFVIGDASPRHVEIYNQVLRAETECCDLCVIGAGGKEIDAHARAVLAEKGLDGYFGHGLGHGLGRDVHDFGSLSPSSSDTLAEGMVFTVEPGVYIEGFGGVRVEDDVLVTANGPEILTHFPKGLTVVG